MALFALLCMTACPLKSRNTLVLATDHAELAAYVEMFNAEQEEYRVELVYSDNPARELKEGSAEYDIIFAEHLAAGAYISEFLPLDELFTEYGLSRDLFYRESLDTGVFEEKQVILPVSFTLPSILLRTGSAPEGADGISLPLDVMREECSRFNLESTQRFPIMGFSPRWRQDFLYRIARIQGTGFRESGGGSVVWNSGNLQRSLEYIREWVYTVNGGDEAENIFREKYLYDPGYKLVFSGRIRFYPVDYGTFLLIPADMRRDVDFLWLSDGRRIPVNEDMVYAGISANPGNRKAAMTFLAWFFNTDTQENLIESTRDKRVRTFGIAGGFSSLKSVNELILPKYFPNVTGRIPAEGQLDFPPVLPREWNRIKEEVIIPYLREAVVSKGTTETLENRLLTWYTQQVP